MANAAKLLDMLLFHTRMAAIPWPTGCNMSTRARVLYVDDERENLTSFKYLFGDDYDVFLASSAQRRVLDHEGARY